MSDAAHLTQQPNGEPVIHARRGPDYRAICGAPPGSPWTLVRRNVTCRECVAEIERRVAAKSATTG